MELAGLDVRFRFRVFAAFGTVFIAVMSCRKQRMEADGVGCGAAKAVKADKVEDEDDDDVDEWKDDDDEETDEGSW